MAKIAILGYGNLGRGVECAVKQAPDMELVAVYALDQSGFRADESLYINAHGTGTQLNDKTETTAIKIALGEEGARRAAISSTKSMTGHMIGAAGATEVLVSALALRDGVIPPTIGLTDPDPECDLDYTPLTAAERPVTIAISNSLGFGGHDATVALRKI